jgi:hypothetical protein
LIRAPCHALHASFTRSRLVAEGALTMRSRIVPLYLASLGSFLLGAAATEAWQPLRQLFWRDAGAAIILGVAMLVVALSWEETWARLANGTVRFSWFWPICVLVGVILAVGNTATLSHYTASDPAYLPAACGGAVYGLLAGVVIRGIGALRRRTRGARQ